MSSEDDNTTSASDLSSSRDSSSFSDSDSEPEVEQLPQPAKKKQKNEPKLIISKTRTEIQDYYYKKENLYELQRLISLGESAVAKYDIKKLGYDHPPTKKINFDLGTYESLVRRSSLSPSEVGKLFSDILYLTLELHEKEATTKKLIDKYEEVQFSLKMYEDLELLANLHTENIRREKADSKFMGSDLDFILSIKHNPQKLSTIFGDAKASSVSKMLLGFGNKVIIPDQVQKLTSVYGEGLNIDPIDIYLTFEKDIIQKPAPIKITKPEVESYKPSTLPAKRPFRSTVGCLGSQVTVTEYQGSCSELYTLTNVHGTINPTVMTTKTQNSAVVFGISDKRGPVVSCGFFVPRQDVRSYLEFQLNKELFGQTNPMFVPTKDEGLMVWDETSVTKGTTVSWNYGSYVIKKIFDSEEKAREFTKKTVKDKIRDTFKKKLYELKDQMTKKLTYKEGSEQICDDDCTKSVGDMLDILDYALGDGKTFVFGIRWGLIKDKDCNVMFDVLEERFSFSGSLCCKIAYRNLTKDEALKQDLDDVENKRYILLGSKDLIVKFLDGNEELSNDELKIVRMFYEQKLVTPRQVRGLCYAFKQTLSQPTIKLDDNSTFENNNNYKLTTLNFLKARADAISKIKVDEDKQLSGIFDEISKVVDNEELSVSSFLKIEEGLTLKSSTRTDLSGLILEVMSIINSKKCLKSPTYRNQKIIKLVNGVVSDKKKSQEVSERIISKIDSLYALLKTKGTKNDPGKKNLKIEEIKSGISTFVTRVFDEFSDNRTPEEKELFQHTLGIVRLLKDEFSRLYDDISMNYESMLRNLSIATDNLAEYVNSGVMNQELKEFSKATEKLSENPTCDQARKVFLNVDSEFSDKFCSYDSNNKEEFITNYQNLKYGNKKPVVGDKLRKFIELFEDICYQKHKNNTDAYLYFVFLPLSLITISQKRKGHHEKLAKYLISSLRNLLISNPMNMELTPEILAVGDLDALFPELIRGLLVIPPIEEICNKVIGGIEKQEEYKAVIDVPDFDISGMRDKAHEMFSQFQKGGLEDIDHENDIDLKRKIVYKIKPGIDVNSIPESKLDGIIEQFHRVYKEALLKKKESEDNKTPLSQKYKDILSLIPQEKGSDSEEDMGIQDFFATNVVSDKLKFTKFGVGYSNWILFLINESYDNRLKKARIAAELVSRMPNYSNDIKGLIVDYVTNEIRADNYIKAYKEGTLNKLSDVYADLQFLKRHNSSLYASYERTVDKLFDLYKNREENAEKAAIIIHTDLPGEMHKNVEQAFRSGVLDTVLSSRKRKIEKLSESLEEIKDLEYSYVIENKRTKIAKIPDIVKELVVVAIKDLVNKRTSSVSSSLRSVIAYNVDTFLSRLEGVLFPTSRNIQRPMVPPNFNWSRYVWGTEEIFGKSSRYDTIRICKTDDGVIEYYNSRSPTTTSVVSGIEAAYMNLLNSGSDKFSGGVIPPGAPTEFVSTKLVSTPSTKMRISDLKENNKKGIYLTKIKKTNKLPSEIRKNKDSIEIIQYDQLRQYDDDIIKMVNNKCEQLVNI